MNFPRENNEKFLKIFLTPEEVSASCGIAVGTLANLRYQKKGPKFYKLPGGRKVLYKLSDIEEWLSREPVLTKEYLE